MKTTAFAWASGRIEFTTPKRVPKVPEGALPIITGTDRTVRSIVAAIARHGHRKPGGKYVFLVPGVPEASMFRYDPVEKLKEFTAWAQRRLDKLEGRAA